MPTIFDIFGIRGYFYAGDHEPMHLHVIKGGKEAVIEIGEELRIRENHGLSNQDIKKALHLVETFRDDIEISWNKYHSNK